MPPLRAWPLALVLVACRAPLPPPPPVTTELEPKTIELPAASAPLAACTPTGVELCFNAVDDNCNGVIDEGCGVHTGLLQIAMAWEKGPDVDLNVTDPTGEMARPGDKTQGGLRKDRDCGSPNDGCHGQNLENVHFDGDAPPKGRYQIEVRLQRANPDQLPVRVRLGLRIGARTHTLELQLSHPGEAQIVAFTL